jgi:hypothetical protein
MRLGAWTEAVGRIQEIKDTSIKLSVTYVIDLPQKIPLPETPWLKEGLIVGVLMTDDDHLYIRSLDKEKPDNQLSLRPINQELPQETSR